MSGERYPKDENLRLILSNVTDLDRALRHDIRMSLGFVRVMAVALAAGIAWMAAGFPGVSSRPAAVAVALVLIVASSAGLLRHLLRLRRYKGYLKDHRVFLKKYNRA
jgi:hypothetical protein